MHRVSARAYGSGDTSQDVLLTLQVDSLHHACGMLLVDVRRLK